VCGIVAVVASADAADPPRPEDLRSFLEQALGALPEASSDAAGWADGLAATAEALEHCDRLLRGVAAVALLVAREDLCADLRSGLEVLADRARALDRALDEGAAAAGGTASLEAIQAALVRARDAIWAVLRDRLGHADGVRALTGGAGEGRLVEHLSPIETVFSALDRLEVRGRDSAGVHVLVDLPPAGPTAGGVEPTDQRAGDGLFTSGAVLSLGPSRLGFVYKAAAEIGELGDNGRRLRRAVTEDGRLRAGLAAADRVSVLGHTRWASVGMISEPNAHPLNSEELGTGDAAPYVVAALNGDVDNYVDLVERDGLRLAEEISTDAKVIPVLVSRRLQEGLSLEEAFRRTVASFQGSVAIAVQSAEDPDLLLLALHGSGQALYVGLAQGAFVVASEPYGLVEQTSHYLRLDGETPGNPANPSASRGQIVVLDRRRAGSLAGMRRIAYDGTELPVDESELLEAEITTRDIDRDGFPHFLLKEIHQAPSSFRKTLRGKVHTTEDGQVEVRLGQRTLPPALVDKLAAGAISRILVIGQGTAAVAGRAVAVSLSDVMADERLRVEALPATELSGFRLEADMADALVVAISQSGTTTDTNRTVDLVRARGATVVSIVNRRGSDLVDKSDGVLFTSDGRDVEMSVASTKAFYSQVAAGFLLALGLRQAMRGDGLSESETRLVRGLRELPELMEKIFESRERIAEVAAAVGPSRRYWAVVGNGANRAAAEEIRIKLSELCYKSIACDFTEDKKHIDLSAEPLILVCAAGLSTSNLSDVAKEVAIYRAHKAAPIVIATEGAEAFAGVEHLLRVPACEPRLAFVLATAVGHLFGYEAALAIDRLALPLRQMRAAIEELAVSAEPGENLLETLTPQIESPVARLLGDLAASRYDGQLEASTAVRLSTLLGYARGIVPLESFSAAFDRPGTPSMVVEELMAALTAGIDELTRPVDAIKHQAKTVTVGISRADEGLLQVALVEAVLATGVPRERISYRDLRTLAGLDPSVAELAGFTRYRVAEGAGEDPGEIQLVESGGVSRDIASRTRQSPVLRGTKHLVTSERHLMVARGRSDGRTVIIVPEMEATKVVGILLLQVDFHQRISVGAMRGVLDSYRNRYTALRDAVMETEPDFDEDLLGRLPVADLLTEPIYDLASHWQRAEAPLGSKEVTQ
jgi:glucosamine--fructose-6-phosphate aminotransferase (isomerizing)